MHRVRNILPLFDQGDISFRKPCCLYNRGQGNIPKLRLNFSNEPTSFLLPFPMKRFPLYRATRLTNDQIKMLRRHIKILGASAPSGSTRELIVEAFHKYGLALDSAIWNSTYLSLWQVLELIAFRPSREQRYDMQSVTKRIRTLLKREDEFVLDLLRMLSNKRNRLVHMGQFSDRGEEDVQLLRAIVDTALMALINLKKKLPTWNSLELYYKNALSQDAEIKMKGRVLRVIESLRR